jgi:prevent-host-death family protein
MGHKQEEVSPRTSGDLREQQISCKLNVMIQLRDIHALSDFQRNSKDYIRKLKKSGKPAVLTVNGEAEVVIQSAEAYQKLLDGQQLLETIRGINRGLDQAKRGEGRPMRALLEELAGEHGIALK